MFEGFGAPSKTPHVVDLDGNKDEDSDKGDGRDEGEEEGEAKENGMGGI